MAVDMVGQRYGRWECLARAPGVDRWLFRCDCGTERERRGHHIRRGASQSCGCLAREAASGRVDMTGQRYGRLVAICRTTLTSTSGWRWLFRCDCGREHESLGSHVRYGRTKSCGCLGREVAVGRLPLLQLRQKAASTPEGLLGRLIDELETDGSDCWLWGGQVNPSGYGAISVEGKPKGVHRVSYALFKGPIELGKLVMHSCDKPLCWNPDHLSVGTHADNTADMVRKGRGTPRKSHCVRGHPYDEANTRVAYGRRYCRACQRERYRRRQGARAEKSA